MEGQSHQGSWDFGRFFDDCLFDDYGSGVSFEVTYRLYQHFGLSLDAAQVIHGLVVNASECGALVEIEERTIYI